MWYESYPNESPVFVDPYGFGIGGDIFVSVSYDETTSTATYFMECVTTGAFYSYPEHIYGDTGSQADFVIEKGGNGLSQRGTAVHPSAAPGSTTGTATHTVPASSLTTPTTWCGTEATSLTAAPGRRRTTTPRSPCTAPEPDDVSQTSVGVADAAHRSVGSLGRLRYSHVLREQQVRPSGHRRHP